VARAATHLFTSVDKQIDAYKEKFKHLKQAFQGYAALQTEIMVTRILDVSTSSSEFRFIMRRYENG
jgi:hypothetical protein